MVTPRPRRALSMERVEDGGDCGVATGVGQCDAWLVTGGDDGSRDDAVCAGSERGGVRGNGMRSGQQGGGRGAGVGTGRPAVVDRAGGGVRGGFARWVRCCAPGPWSMCGRGSALMGTGTKRRCWRQAGAIAGIAEKRRLVESYGAVMVDMEAACVARLAQAHGLAFGAIKAISDASGVSLDGMERFATADGRFREMAFARHVALRPHRWRSAVRLGRDSARALRALTTAVLEDLERQG